MTRAYLTLSICLAMMGCTTPNKIPTPTKDWKYRYTQNSDADYTLELAINKGWIISMNFIKQAREDQSFSLGPLSLSCGTHGSTRNEHRVTNVNEEGISLHLHRTTSYINQSPQKIDDLNITIPYTTTGTGKHGAYSYSWIWIDHIPTETD